MVYVFSYFFSNSGVR
jgi:hypothetical protein